MKFNRTLKIAVAAIAILGSSTALYGFGRGGHGDPAAHAERIKERIADKLDLTDAQKTELDGLFAEITGVMTEMRDSRQKDMGDILERIKSSELQPDEMLQRYKERRDQLDGKLPSIMNRVAALHKTLSAEQKAELAELVEKFHNKRQHRRGKGQKASQ